MQSRRSINIIMHVYRKAPEVLIEPVSVPLVLALQTLLL